jgi:hypothetical protein
MPMSGDNVNLGNPCNDRRDAEERNDAKVTNADHPISESGRPDQPRAASRPGGAGADDLFDDSVGSAGAPQAAARRPGPESDPLLAVVPELAGQPAGGIALGGSPPMATILPPTFVATTPPPASARQHFDSHAETIHDPELEMPGERTSHVDPLSGDTGMHAVGVGVGATAGGAMAGAVIGFAGGGYTGKHIAERVNPTTEDHHWRHAYSSREYVTRGDTYETWEPAYEYGIEMREWLLDKTWEEAEPMIKTGWEQSAAGATMPWERAKPAILDAWDHLTPEPGEPEVTEAERQSEE